MTLHEKLDLLILHGCHMGKMVGYFGICYWGHCKTSYFLHMLLAQFHHLGQLNYTRARKLIIQAR